MSVHSVFWTFLYSFFEILNWNSVYEFVLTWYRSSSTFDKFDILLLELLPLTKILFKIYGLSLPWLEIWHEFVLTWYRTSLTLVACDLFLHTLLPFARIYLVFRTFLCHFSRYWSSTFVASDQLLIELLPFAEIQFPDFSLLSFVISAWNLVYQFVSFYNLAGIIPPLLYYFMYNFSNTYRIHVPGLSINTARHFIMTEQKSTLIFFRLPQFFLYMKILQLAYIWRMVQMEKAVKY